MKSTVRNIALAMHHFTHPGFRIVIAIFMLSLAFAFQKANAQTPYNPGKLAVLVVGDGSVAPSGSASPVFVKEFNTEWRCSIRNFKNIIAYCCKFWNGFCEPGTNTKQFRNFGRAYQFV